MQGLEDVHGHGRGAKERNESGGEKSGVSEQGSICKPLANIRPNGAAAWPRDVQHAYRTEHEKQHIHKTALAKHPHARTTLLVGSRIRLPPLAQIELV